MAEQIRENIVNIKETQEELKKEVDSLVLEHLKQQQQTPKALNIRESLQTLTRKVTQLETTLEQVRSHVDYMLSDYLESLESIIGQLEVEQLNTKSNLEKILGALKEKQDKLEKDFQESIQKRCMEAVPWWMKNKHAWVSSALYVFHVFLGKKFLKGSEKKGKNPFRIRERHEGSLKTV